MAGIPAESDDVSDIRRLALDPSKVRTTATVKYDLLGRQLTKDEVCEAIVKWIDDGKRVKAVVLHSGLDAGITAYEMKPRIGDIRLYVKVKMRDVGQSNELLILISAHPDH